jgi:hypothetical protein
MTSIVDKLHEKLENEDNLNPTMTNIKKYYTPAQKKAIETYRNKNREKYNEQMRNLYNVKRNDEEWLKNRNEKSKEANKKYREKKLSVIPVEERKPRGRPKKI